MVNRKWAYRELFDSEEEAARAYDDAVWRLKPKEAKSYINFKERYAGDRLRLPPRARPPRQLSSLRSVSDALVLILAISRLPTAVCYLLPRSCSELLRPHGLQHPAPACRRWECTLLSVRQIALYSCRGDGVPSVASLATASRPGQRRVSDTPWPVRQQVQPRGREQRLQRLRRERRRLLPGNEPD
jgi:hypothetical protein